MCVFSMIGDHYTDKWRDPNRWPTVQPFPVPTSVPVPIGPLSTEEVIRRAIEITRRSQEEADRVGTRTDQDIVSRQDFEKLREEVLEMRDLLKRAIKYDRENSQPDCETEDKVALLKQMAKLMNVDMKDIFEDER